MFSSRQLTLAAWGTLCLLFAAARLAHAGEGPGRPRLVFPPNGGSAAEYASSWAFRWKPPADQPDRQKYLLWIARPGAARPLVLQEVAAAPDGSGAVRVSAIQINLPVFMVAEGDEFLWKVRPVGALGEWSDTWSFHIGASRLAQGRAGPVVRPHPAAAPPRQEAASAPVRRAPGPDLDASTAPPIPAAAPGGEASPPQERPAPPSAGPFAPPRPFANEPPEDRIPPQYSRPYPPGRPPRPDAEPPQTPAGSGSAAPAVAAPVPELPRAAEVVTDPTVSLNFRWRPVAAPAVSGYQVLVEPPGGGVRVRSVGRQTHYAYTEIAPTGPPLPAGAWRWRVRAILAQPEGTAYGAWSASRRFQVAYTPGAALTGRLPASAGGGAAPPGLPGSLPAPGAPAPPRSGPDPTLLTIALAAVVGLVLAILLILLASNAPRRPAAVAPPPPGAAQVEATILDGVAPAAARGPAGAPPAFLGAEEEADPVPDDAPRAGEPTAVDFSLDDAFRGTFVVDGATQTFEPVPPPDLSGFDNRETGSPAHFAGPEAGGGGAAMPPEVEDWLASSLLDGTPEEAAPTVVEPLVGAAPAVPPANEVLSPPEDLSRWTHPLSEPGTEAAEHADSALAPRVIRHRESGDILFQSEGESLRGADLRAARLTGADLLREDLEGADLRGAELASADFSRANLRDADLRGADLRGAELSGADLAGANLAGANLAGAELRGALLDEADLTGADLTGANLYGARLEGAALAGILQDAQTLWPPTARVPDLPIRAITIE